MNTKIMVLVGTRPEAIKTAPVVRTFRQWGLGNYLLLVNTGQHQELQQPFGELFGVEPDYDLGISSKGLPLAELLARTLAGLQTLLNHLTTHGTHIGSLMAQGDTNTVLAACLTAQLNRVPFAHLEAGLRSHHFAEPFPEEYNRRVAALNATVHFAPTPAARDNLLREGVAPAKILLTGNTGVDALRIIDAQNRPAPLAGDIGKLVRGRNLVLITCHRRENLGEKMIAVLETVIGLARDYPNLQFLWIQHPNSADALDRYTKGHLPRNFRFWPPVGYLEMLTLYRACRLVISDSGGVQEEAPDFGLPVLVTRSVTERPEGIALGCAELTGAEPDRIIHAFHRKIREKVTLRGNPYGDGKAAGRIMEWFLEHQLPVPEFSTVFVGGGPAGTGPLICALQTGRLERLLERKIALVEASGDLGKGTIGNYIVNSDTLVDVFLECLAGEAGQKLSETRQSAEAQALYEYAGQHIPLSMVSTYLAALGRDLERLVTAHPGSQVFQHTRVDVIRVLESGKCLVHAVDTGGHTPAGQQAFLAHSVVLATGGRQDRETVLDACITPSIRLRGFAGKVLTTDHLLTEAGVKEAEVMLRATSRTKVVIIGGSHSAFSSAWVLLHQMPGIEFGQGDITLLYRRPPKLYFPSVDAALRVGYSDFTTQDICPRTRRVHRLGGLRFDGRQLLMRIWGLEEGSRETRVRLLHIPAVEAEVLGMLREAALIVPAFGYRPAPPRIVDHLDQKVGLLCEKGGPLVNDRCEVLKADGSVLPNVYGIGLASGFIPSGKLGGEPGFVGQTNGLWLYQHGVGEIILDQLLSTKVSGSSRQGE